MSETDILDRIRDWAAEQSGTAGLSDGYYEAVDDVLAILDDSDGE